MEGVAARAGVSKALGYRYFDNADGLLLAVADREMVEVAARVSTAISSATTFEDALRTSLGAWFDVLSERGTTIVVIMTSPTLAGPLGDRRRELRNAVGRYYGVRAAEAFGLTPHLADMATTILLAGLEGVIDCWLDRRIPRRELVDAYTTMCMAAFQALADEPPVIGEPNPSRAD